MISLVALILGSCQSAAPPPTRTLQGLIPGRAGQLGAPYRIDVPGRWSGTLWVYSHGTILAGRRVVVLTAADDALDAGLRRWLLARGDALAGTAYAHPTGWAVEDSLQDQVAVLDVFERLVGKPTRTIAFGESQGGLDTALLLERYRDRFQGGFSMCGLLGGGLEYFNHDLDMFFTLDVLLASGALIHADAPTRAGIDSGGAEDVLTKAEATPGGEARLALVAALQDFPARFQPSDPEPAPGNWASVLRGQTRWIEFALGTNFRQDVERRANGNPSWNTGVDYAAMLRSSPYAAEVSALYTKAGISIEADLARLAAAPRIVADPAAVQYMTQFGEASGELDRPLLTLHTTDDGRVIAGNEVSYATQVAARGRVDDLRQLYVSRGGHCAFSDSELISGMQVLEQRLESGRWPDLSPAAMNRRTRALTTYAQTGPLSYVISDAGRYSSYTPAPLPR